MKGYVAVLVMLVLCFMVPAFVSGAGWEYSSDPSLSGSFNYGGIWANYGSQNSSYGGERLFGAGCPGSHRSTVLATPGGIFMSGLRLPRIGLPLVLWKGYFPAKNSFPQAPGLRGAKFALATWQWATTCIFRPSTQTKSGRKRATYRAISLFPRAWWTEPLSPIMSIRFGRMKPPNGGLLRIGWRGIWFPSLQRFVCSADFSFASAWLSVGVRSVNEIQDDFVQLILALRIWFGALFFFLICVLNREVWSGTSHRQRNIFHTWVTISLVILFHIYLTEFFAKDKIKQYGWIKLYS